MSFTSWHKFYVSLTQIEHVPEKRSIQIITRIFIDDLEQAIREQYDNEVTLGVDNEDDSVDDYVQSYLKEKIVIKIDDQQVSFKFIGKSYDLDIVKCYLEIEDIEKIKSFEISNHVLFDLFPDQQNIVKTKINSKQKSFILVSKDRTALLKFN